MTPEGKLTLRFFCHAAAVFVPLVAVPCLTFTLPHWRAAPTMDDPNPAVRVAALRASGWQGRVDLLTKALHDEDADVRLVAAMRIGWRTEQAGEIAKVLTGLLKDKHQGVRREAIRALNAIGAPAVPALLEALSDPDPRVRAGAIEGFGDRPKDIRKRSPEELAQVIPALEKLQQDEDPDVRRQATRMLRYLHGKRMDDD